MNYSNFSTDLDEFESISYHKLKYRPGSGDIYGDEKGFDYLNESGDGGNSDCFGKGLGFGFGSGNGSGFGFECAEAMTYGDDDGDGLGYGKLRIPMNRIS
jgi:hypothetical protein